MKIRLFTWLMRPLLHRIAPKVWAGNLSKSQIDLVLTDTWKRYSVLAPDLGKQPNLRTWLVMNFACLTLSGYQALLEMGIDSDEAYEMVSRLTWQVTFGVTRTADRISKPFFRDNQRRMEGLVDLVMSLVFFRPAYRTEKGQLPGGFYMNMHSCPVAEYLAASNTADLCISAWCGVDGGLVEVLGGRLERGGTIAMGAEYCDFKFFVE